MKGEAMTELLDELTNKWKSTSGGKKVMWLAIALLAVYLAYKLKQSWNEIRSNRKPIQ